MNELINHIAAFYTAGDNASKQELDNKHEEILKVWHFFHAHPNHPDIVREALLKAMNDNLEMSKLLTNN